VNECAVVVLLPSDMPFRWSWNIVSLMGFELGFEYRRVGAVGT
jgi:hypothetical protein